MRQSGYASIPQALKFLHDPEHKNGKFHKDPKKKRVIQKLNISFQLKVFKWQ